MQRILFFDITNHEHNFWFHIVDYEYEKTKKISKIPIYGVIIFYANNTRLFSLWVKFNLCFIF